MLLLHQNICTIKSVHYNSHITLLLHNVFHNIIQNMSENLLYMELLCMILYLSTFISSQNLRNQVLGNIVFLLLDILLVDVVYLYRYFEM